MKKLQGVLIAVLVAIASSVWAGPFGTEMGDPVEKFQGLSPMEQTSFTGKAYSTFDVPKKHSTFENYALYFGEEGLAQIIAISKNYDNDSHAPPAKPGA